MMTEQAVLAWVRPLVDPLAYEAIRRYVAGEERVDPKRGGVAAGMPPPDEVAERARRQGDDEAALDLACVAIRVVTGIAWGQIGVRYLLAGSEQLPEPTATWAQPARRRFERLTDVPGVGANELAPAQEKGLRFPTIADRWGVPVSLDNARFGPGRAFHRPGTGRTSTGGVRARRNSVAMPADLRRDWDGLTARLVGLQLEVDGVMCSVTMLDRHRLELTAPDGQVVTVHRDAVLRAVAGLREGGRCELDAANSGLRAVLAELDGVEVRDGHAVTVDLHEATPLDVAETDAYGRATVRREQRRLRELLVDGRDTAACALCGSQLPIELLVAAHIKPRAVCSEDERRDRRIVMLACMIGCDALFEHRIVAVDTDGSIVAGDGYVATTPIVRHRAADLVGRTCSAHDDHTKPYFAWHRHQALRASRRASARPVSQG